MCIECMYQALFSGYVCNITVASCMQVCKICCHVPFRWRFIVHGGIDGFSRFIVFLYCATDNRSETVLQSFDGAVKEFGLPDRVRM